MPKRKREPIKTQFSLIRQSIETTSTMLISHRAKAWIEPNFRRQLIGRCEVLLDHVNELQYEILHPQEPKE